ncbi:MAG: hypothetical protein PHQ28_08540 [Mycobacterium sp.]|nr:hypothetical protein [Mycobacterium sp.]
MSPASLSQDLCGFAIELRQLAYTMPGGCEDALIRLSERMAHTAAEHDRGAGPAASQGPLPCSAARVD